MRKRRDFIKGVGAVALLGGNGFDQLFAKEKSQVDSLPMQLFKSMSDEQISKVCLPLDHPGRQFVSNWWYIHPDHRIPGTI